MCPKYRVAVMELVIVGDGPPATMLLPRTRRGCDSQNYFQIVSVPDQSKESQTFHCLLYWFMLLKKQKSLEMILLEFSAL